MKIVIDDVGNGVKPVYESSIGRVVLMAIPKGEKHIECKERTVLVPLLPITPEVLRCMAETIEIAERENKDHGVLVIDSKNGTVGLLAH